MQEKLLDFAEFFGKGKTPEENFLGGSFCVKSNRGIQRLLGDVAVNVNEDCNNVLSSVVVLEYDVSILGALNAIILDCAVVISSLVIIAAYVDDLNIIVNRLGVFAESKLELKALSP